MRGSYQRLFSTLAASSAVRWSSLAFSPRLATTTTTRLTSTSLFSSSSATTSHEKLCLGGDFAGLMPKFSSTDGSLVPIPVYLIPESLLEWGQEPSSLEVLTSEEWKSKDSLQRQEITIYPAVGCGVDNLETSKSQLVLEKEQHSMEWSQPSDSTLILDSTTSTKESATVQRVETQFALSDNHRVRVSLDLQIEMDEETAYSYQIQSPIVLNLERQSNTTSSQGTRADGGGLDGRTVSQLLGDRLWKSPKFAEQKYSPGEWKATEGGDNHNQFIPSTQIHLPGNITIASGPASDTEGTWLLELIHFFAETGSRRIVQRRYDGLQKEATYKEELGEYIE